MPQAAPERHWSKGHCARHGEEWVAAGPWGGQDGDRDTSLPPESG